MKKILFSLLLLPSITSAASIVTYPTSANNANIAFTAAGKAKIEAVAKQQATASALLYKNSSIKDAFIKIKLFYKGMESQVYHRIANYVGPSGADSWALTFQQSGTDCGGSCYQTLSRWSTVAGIDAYARNTAVVDYPDKTGTCYTSLLQGFTWTSVPNNYFVCGKLIKTRNYFNNQTFCTPNGASEGELFTTLWCGLVVSFYEGPALEMTLPGAWVLSKGVGPSDLAAGLIYPEPSGETATIPPPSGLIDTTPYEDYIEKGGIVLEDTDITTFTITGASGDDSSDGDITTTINVSSVTVNVEVNVSTAEIVDRLDTINETLTEGSTETVNTLTPWLNDVVGNAIDSVDTSSYTAVLNKFTVEIASTSWEPCFTLSWGGLWGAADQEICLSSWPNWNGVILPLIQFALVFGTALWCFLYMWEGN
jgi:hypothetical protein